jgi:DNA repair protein RecO (recombination protein O)
MPLHKSRAIVIKSINFGEGDQIVSFFTQLFGKLRAVAKGSRKHKTKLGASLQPLTLVELIYFAREGQELPRINSCDIVYSFPAIKGDFERIKRSYYGLELINLIIPEGEQEFKLFSLFTNFLFMLEKVSNIDSLLRAFEWQLLAASGFKPQLSYCVVCKSSLKKEKVDFSVVLGGTLCNKCSAQFPDVVKISPEGLRSIKKALEIDFLTLGANWSLPEKLDKELRDIAQTYFSYHLNKEIKTAKFLYL